MVAEGDSGEKGTKRKRSGTSQCVRAAKLGRGKQKGSSRAKGVTPARERDLPPSVRGKALATKATGARRRRRNRRLHIEEV
jgi:hypothetical protein